MLQVQSGRTFYPTLIGAPPGRTGFLTLAIEWLNNTVYSPASSAGIDETASGSYTATRVAPVANGQYLLVWEDATFAQSTTELFEVVGYRSPINQGVPYATLEQYKAHARTELPIDAVIQRALWDATLDVDNLLPGNPDDLTGLRLDVDELEVWRQDALARATVNQAEFRIYMGPDYFLTSSSEVITGPDFTIDRSSASGSKRRWHPQTLVELRRAGLLMTGARAEAGSRYNSGNELRMGGGNALRRIY